MATANINQLENLPWELLEKITELLPIPDVLGLKQINRGFRDLIRCSPRIQHKLGLYASGLEPNLAAGVTVADSIKALEEYRSKWDKPSIEDQQTAVRIPIREFERDGTAGGVYGLATKHEILFFTLPSNSRTIQSRKQTISFDFRVTGFAFHPQADVVVVAGQTGHVVNLRLITMSEGLPHPSAHKKIIECVTGSIDPPRDVSLSITGRRLALMVNHRDLETSQLNVWDWRTGEHLFEHYRHHHQLLGFLDDYRLAIKVALSSDGLTPRLLLLDAEQVPSGVPVQTWFYGPMSPQRWTWIVEAGGHEPSPQDTLTAPFYPDPSQRILALSRDVQEGFSVMKVGTLLRLAREQARGEVRWGEWSPHLLQTSLKWGGVFPFDFERSWVSGFRLFRASLWRSTYTCYLHVYDFSPRGRTKHLWTAADCRRAVRPSLRGMPLNRNYTDICGFSFGHDSLVYRVRSDEPGSEDFTTLQLLTL